MKNMDKFVQEYLESEEGKVWLASDETQYMLREIKAYIDDIAPLAKSTIEYMHRYFPEFTFRGKAYRFISQSKEKESPLEWDRSFDNFSWSTDPKAYKSVQYSLTNKNHIIHIYQAHVVGLNLKDLINHLQWHQQDLKGSYGLVERESEILMIDYRDLELYEKLEE